MRFFECTKRPEKSVKTVKWVKTKWRSRRFFCALSNGVIFRIFWRREVSNLIQSFLLFLLTPSPDVYPFSCIMHWTSPRESFLNHFPDFFFFLSQIVTNQFCKTKLVANVIFFIPVLQPCFCFLFSQPNHFTQSSGVFCIARCRLKLFQWHYHSLKSLQEKRK